MSWPIIGCTLSGAALAGVLLGLHMAGHRPEERTTPPPAPAPFTELDAAIAARGYDSSWRVYRRPDLPGPYRVLDGTCTVGRNPDQVIVLSHPDASGRFVAPIELRGHPDFDQMAVHLETSDGRITGVVLKR